MACLEDFSHPPRSEPVQQDVGSQGQLLPPAFPQQLDLERRQPAAPDQVFGQGLRIRGTLLEFPVQKLQLPGLQHRAGFQEGNK